MALDRGVYFVSADIARRTGMINARYRILDGRFVVDNKDLARVRLMASEYVTGLVGIEKVSESEAKRQINMAGYVMGEVKPEPAPAPTPEPTPTPNERPDADVTEQETIPDEEEENENKNIEEETDDGNNQ